MILVTVAELKEGDRFLWGKDEAVVKDIVEMPEHIMSTGESLVYSLDIEMPPFRGAVHILGDKTVELVAHTE